jgi:hypothetical protein
MHKVSANHRHNDGMLGVFVALVATGVSFRLALANWPTDSDGKRLPRNYLSRDRVTELLEFPAICLSLGLLVSAPGFFAGGGATFVVACLVAVCLGGVLFIQTDTMHRTKPHH